MKKLLTIGAWFCLFIFMIVAVLFWMPDNYRIHPRLKMPDIVFLRSQPPTKILIVGDSFAQYAPWPVAKRICYGGIRITRIIEMVQYQDVDDSITDILILAGIASHFSHGESMVKIKEDMVTLEHLLIRKYPKANISKVSINDMLQCSDEYPRGEKDRHLSPAGYEVLRQRHFSHLIF